MKSSNKKGNFWNSIMGEILIAIGGFFLGDIRSKIGLAFLSLLLGIVVITRPFKDMDGNELEKSSIPFVIGTVLILISIVLIISWLRNRKTEKNE